MAQLSVEETHVTTTSSVPNDEEKECFRCKKTGHFAKDCPLKRRNQVNNELMSTYTPASSTSSSNDASYVTTNSSSVTKANIDDVCYRCKSSGHMAKDCPTKKRKTVDSYVPPAETIASHISMSDPSIPASDDVCYRCKTTGHMAKDCPTKKRKVTESTEESFGYSQTPSSVSIPTTTDSDNVCYRCQSSGHMAKDCPTKKRKQSSQDESDAPITKPEKQSYSTSRKAQQVAEEKNEDTGPKLCFRCQSSDHLIEDCSVPKICYHCHLDDHLSVECPQRRLENREVLRKVTKECSICSSTEHLARYCPDAKRPQTMRAQSSKERAVDCYICRNVGHHAKECEELTKFTSEVQKYLKARKNESTGTKPESESKSNFSLQEYEQFIEKCCTCLEFRGAVYFFYEIQAHGLSPSPIVISSIKKLYESGAADHSSIKGFGAAVSSPRKELKKIYMSFKLEETGQKLGKELAESKLWLGKHEKPRNECENRFAVAKLLKNQFQYSQKLCRDVVSALKRAGIMVENKKALGWKFESKPNSTSSNSTSKKRASDSDLLEAQSNPESLTELKANKAKKVK